MCLDLHTEGEGKCWASCSLWGLGFATDRMSTRSPHSIQGSPQPGPGLWVLHGGCRAGWPPQQSHAGKGAPSLALRTEVGRASGPCDGCPHRCSTGLRGWPRNSHAFRSRPGDVPVEWRCARWRSLAIFSAVSNTKCTFSGIVAFELGLSPSPGANPVQFQQIIGAQCSTDLNSPRRVCKIALHGSGQLLSLARQL